MTPAKPRSLVAKPRPEVVASKRSSMPRYALEIEFDGRDFQGTQVQSSGRTLQGELSTILSGFAGVPVMPRPASRLDAGVSAETLPCDITLSAHWDPRELGAALNARLPKDIVIRRMAVVPDDWHSQIDAKAKHYRYSLLQRPSRPALPAQATWIRRLDHPDRLQGMAALLVGRQDLSGFSCLRRDDSDADDPIREVISAHWSTQETSMGTRWTFRICGTGFLYKQIRGMVGAMLVVAQGRRAQEEFVATVISGRKAVRLGNIAPAHGLVLERVDYQPQPPWETL
jgi:tRNA pseudouridine38-40 synthase